MMGCRAEVETSATSNVDDESGAPGSVSAFHPPFPSPLLALRPPRSFLRDMKHEGQDQ